MIKNEFQPDWFSAPGDTMADILQERNLSILEFAERLGHTLEYAKELISGREAVTNKTARQLETVLGGSVEFWINRESQYRKDLNRLRQVAADVSGVQWLSTLPLKDMIRFGWIEPVSGAADEVAACLKFFDMPNVKMWQDTYSDVFKMAAFRTSPTFESQFGTVSAWLRQGEIESAAVNCKPWDASQLRKVLVNIRPLTRKKSPALFIPELQKLCGKCGVSIVIVRAPEGCRASGATRFLSTNKALLLLSFRYLSDDHFWFTFFHEVGHLLLHSTTTLFLESTDMASSKEEEEANEFAANVLVPSEFQEELKSLGANRRDVIRFAHRVGVSPGIVVGQLQHLGKIRHNQLNTLKRRFNWVEE